MEIGKKIYLAILDKRFRSTDLCNICYTMMQNYRLLEGKDRYEDTAERLGQRGGQTTAKRGAEYYRKIGKLGAARRWKKSDSEGVGGGQ
jgi:hypothetical protein